MLFLYAILIWDGRYCPITSTSKDPKIQIPCFWSVYGPEGLLMGFLSGKTTFFGQLTGPSITS
jgi:hypothetical protein